MLQPKADLPQSRQNILLLCQVVAEQVGDFFFLHLRIQDRDVRSISHEVVRERSSTAIITSKKQLSAQKNKEDEVIMVLAQLALAEGIFSPARTDSVLFLSKAVETTVHVAGIPSPFPKYSC